MADSRPVTSAELAAKTNTYERYIREWLASQAAAGYVNYNPSDDKYSLPVENAFVLAEENSPAYIQGAYQLIRSIFKDEEKFVEMFRTGKGLLWGEHHHDLFEGTAKFFKSAYIWQSCPILNSITGGGRGKTSSGCEGGRYRMWLWCPDSYNGKSLSQF